MNRNGFSFIEVLIFTGVLSLFFVVAAAITSSSIRNLKINEHKTIATHYADELTEWLRYQKDNDWYAFATKSKIPSGTYCFNSDTINWLVPDACPNPQYSLGGIFRREAVFTPNQPDPVTKIPITITVSWSEPNKIYSITQKVLFTIYE